MNKKKHLSKRIIKIIVCAVAVFAAILSLIVTNMFIPVKYLGAYAVFKKDEADENSMRIRYIDVGFGDCALIEFPDGKTMLIDGGSAAYSNVRKILEIMNTSGIDKLDYLVCTSVKSEHCGGLAEIVKYKPVDTAYIPEAKNLGITEEYAEFYSVLSESGAKTEISVCGKGVYNEEFGYNFLFLSPSSDGSEYYLMNSAPSSEHTDAASAVVWLEYSGCGFLFLSDAGSLVQNEIARGIVAEGGAYSIGGKEFSFSPCIALKAAGHCAEDSASAELCDLILPEAAIISVGKNASDCPSDKDLSILQLYVKENIYRTDIDGTVTVNVYERKYLIKKENK